MYIEARRLREVLALVRIGEHVRRALEQGDPIVALETAVMTHGLPIGVHLMAVQDMEAILWARNVTPATVGVVRGRLVIGLSAPELQELAQRAATDESTDAAMRAVKLGARDLGPLLGRLRWYRRMGGEGTPPPLYGGTTVGGTLVACRMLGLRVMATGGIGGVHRFPPYDISGDLPQLALSPVIVVASGVKSLLHVEATFEYLETLGIPVVGYRTDTFPVFYASSYRTAQGQVLTVPYRADTPAEVVEIALAHWSLGMQSGVLLVVPPPADVALRWEELETWTRQALDEARRLGIRGPQVTPFVLSRLQVLSGGRTVEINLALLRQNAQVARDVARALYQLYPELWTTSPG